MDAWAYQPVCRGARGTDEVGLGGGTRWAWVVGLGQWAWDSGPGMWDWEEGLVGVTGTWAWARCSHFDGWVPTGRCRTNALKHAAR